MNRTLAAVLLALVATSAWAQKETIVQEPDRTIVRKNTPIDFGDVKIEGDVTRPADSYIHARPRVIFNNLVKIRGDFAPELQKSVDSL